MEINNSNLLGRVKVDGATAVYASKGMTKPKFGWGGGELRNPLSDKFSFPSPSKSLVVGFGQTSGSSAKSEVVLLLLSPSQGGDQRKSTSTFAVFQSSDQDARLPHICRGTSPQMLRPPPRARAEGQRPHAGRPVT